MRCSRCQGSGTIMGNGMMFIDCDCDNGVAHEPKPVAIDKRSASYREAIKKIMESNEVTREEAVKVFEDEFEKIA
jgi:hypothetical protein